MKYERHIKSDMLIKWMGSCGCCDDHGGHGDIGMILIIKLMINFNYLLYTSMYHRIPILKWHVYHEDIINSDFLLTLYDR
jgi:hypothetical protein